DVFAARIGPGLAATSRRNFRQLGPVPPGKTPVQRAFAVNVQNMTNVNKCVSIGVNNPASGQASFAQSGTPVGLVNVQIWRKSTVSRTVYVTSSNATDQVAVSINVTGTLNRSTQPATCVADNPALQTTLLLN